VKDAVSAVAARHTRPVREFTELTRRGQSRRLRELAVDVVEADYGWADASVRLLSEHSFNTVFRIGHNGRHTALRVGDACRIHVDGVEDVEADWLDALYASGIPCPVNIRSAHGWNSVRRGRADVFGPRVCSMFTWVDGRPLRERLTPEGLRAAGALLAEIHEHATQHEPAAPIPPGLFANRVVYFHEENRVGTYASDFGTLFAEAIDRVQHQLDELWRAPPHVPHLLHGDFGPNNVLTYHSRLSAIDFQDLQFGFDLQDVAISIADMGRVAPEMIDPFRAGYATVRRWPDLTPELQAALTAARSLNIMNLALHVPRPGLAQFLDEHGTRVADWMRTTPSSR
jgi:Ser/Thr protein kinase RdoA (MazF antagonist)